MLDREEGHMNDESSFFQNRPWGEAIYMALKESILNSFPLLDVRVQKTQITLSNTLAFSCVSFMRVMKKSEEKGPYLVLTLGLSHPLNSPRVKAMSEPYPGRWTVHIPLYKPEDVDEEVMEWVKEAYRFAESK